MTKKYRPKKSKKTRIRKEKSQAVAPINYQASLMTDEQYMEQVRKVQKSLPKFDINNDCPKEIKRPSKKKKMPFFKRIFRKR